MKLKPPSNKLGSTAATPQPRADREALDALPAKIQCYRDDAAARFTAAHSRIEAERTRLTAANFPPDLIKRNMDLTEERETKIAREEASAILRTALQELQPYALGIENARIPYADVRRQILLHATKPESAPHTAATLAIVSQLGPEALARYAQMVLDMSGSDDAAAMSRVLPLAHAVVSKLESYPDVASRPVSLSEFMECFSWPAFDKEKARLDGLATSLADFQEDAADIMREGQRSARNKIKRGVSEGHHRPQPGSGERSLNPDTPTGKIARGLAARGGQELI